MCNNIVVVVPLVTLFPRYTLDCYVAAAVINALRHNVHKYDAGDLGRYTDYRRSRQRAAALIRIDRMSDRRNGGSSHYIRRA